MASRRRTGDGPRHRDERGWTLLELMVTVVVIGVLAAIAVPNFLGARDRGQDRAAEANLRTALSAATAIATADGSFAGAGADGLASSVGDLVPLAGTTESTGVRQASVLASASAWIGSVRSATGRCITGSAVVGRPPVLRWGTGPCSAAAAAGYASTVLAMPGLLGFWRLDESSGATAVNLAGGGPDGTYAGSITRGVVGARPSDSNGAVAFGAGGTVEIVGLPTSSAFTINAWIRKAMPDVPAGYDTILATPSFRFQVRDGVNPSWEPVAGVCCGLWAPGSSIPPNQWAMVSYVRNGTTGTLYVNGVAVGSTAAGTGPVTLSPARIGRDGLTGIGSPDEFRDGIDDVAIWNRALTPAELTTLATASA